MVFVFGIDFAIIALMKKIIFTFISLLLGAFFISSCTMERKLALEFVDNDGRDIPVMIVPPPLLYMYNNKSIESLNNRDLNMDSLAFYQSELLQYISDSAFLENYMNAFIQYLDDHHLQVFLPDELTGFTQQRRLSYMVRLAQMELEEDYDTVLAEEKINFQQQTKYIPINKLSLSTWFEISQKDSTSYFTYFDEQYITDDIYGDFRQELWSFDIKYDYTILKIEKEDVYDFATMLGEKHASYVYDLIMNTYIWNKIPEEKRSHYQYLHYNAQYGSVEVAEEAFIRVDDAEQ